MDSKTSGIGSLNINGALRKDKNHKTVSAAGATVIVRNSQTNAIISQGKLDGNGNFFCTIPSGTHVYIEANFDNRVYWHAYWTVPNKGGTKTYTRPLLD